MLSEKLEPTGLKRGNEDKEDIANKYGRIERTAVKSRAVIRFWEKLHEATIQNKNGGKFLTLASGTYFLGQPQYGNQLYQRREYEELDALIDSLLKTESCVAIMGSPGIGKSMFCYWLMHKWALQGRNIVLRKRYFQDKCWVQFCEDGVYRILENTKLMVGLLSDPETRFVVDGMDPGVLPNGAKMIFITLPDEEIYHEFLKPKHHVRRFIDVWNTEEIELVRKSMYESVSPEECQRRLERWGPVPRYVLEKRDVVEQYELERAIALCDLRKLKAESPEFTADDVSYSVVHLKVQPDSQHADFVAIFASDFVAQSIFDRLWREERANVIAWVSAGMNSLELGSLQGIFYELACHRTICEGGTFCVREVADPTSTHSLLIPPSTLKKVDDWSEAAQASTETYCRARKRNMAAIDAVQQPGNMFQITVSNKHSVNCAGLRAAVNAMRNKLDARLYFVVPPDKYTECRSEPIDQGAGVNELRRIEQWVLKMPY